MRWPRLTPAGRILIGCLLLANVLPELVLQAADAELLGTRRWRLYALGYGALWQGLLGDWLPNFALQPLTMFATYGFLHVGAWHLAGNMLGLLLFMPATVRRTGARGGTLVYGAGLFGGALCFALLSDTAQPMVGASGAIYGLAAAWIYWEWRDRRRARAGLAPIWIKSAYLVFANVLGWWLLSGSLAWEAHLGGALCGAVVAWRLDPLRRKGVSRPGHAGGA